MTNNAQQNLIGITEDELKCFVAYFLAGSTPQETNFEAFKAAESAVYLIVERVINGAMLESGASLVMEPASSSAPPDNIIQLPSSKKW